MPTAIAIPIAPRLPSLPVPDDVPAVAGTSYSYILTNRVNPPYTSYYPGDEQKNIVPLSNGNLWWYLSTQRANDPTVGDYQSMSSNPSTRPPSPFSQAIIAQLKAQANPQLTVFIHGLGTEWTDAINDTATLGANLASYANYKGLVIGFDWPSYGELASSIYYASAYPPTATSGSIRDNINGSVAAFGFLINFLQSLRSSISNLTITIVCHSEGNFMSMLGMAPISSVLIDQIVMLAADINNGAFQTPAQGLVGQAAKVATLSRRVTVYYTNSDDVLAASQGTFQMLGFHNPLYGGRLGQTGPAYNIGAQQSTMCSVDCSAVINEQAITNLINKGIIPPGTILHSAYFYVPQILNDIAQTLTGTPAGNVTNRTKTANTNAYFMNLV